MGDIFKINGQQISVGNLNNQKITIRNNRVIVNGVDITPDSKDIKIEITGDVGVIDCDNTNYIKVSGSVNEYVKTTNGDVNIKGNVGGNVQTTNGDVECLNINGSVKTTNGDVLHKK